MKTFKQYLEEKTFNINKDIDLIYRSVFKPFIDNLQRGIIKPIQPITFKSDQLQSKEAKKANELNPVIIRAGAFDDGSYYEPSKNLIQISFNKNVFDIIVKYNSIEKVMNILPAYQRPNFKQEVIGNVVKYTIQHELSHWIDDTFHNRHIFKLLGIAGQAKDYATQHKIVSKGKFDPVATKYEINAQIHSIKKAKIQNKNIWNDITFEELFDLIPALNEAHKKLGNKDKIEWRRNIKSRMAREGLLGKNMR